MNPDRRSARAEVPQLLKRFGPKNDRQLFDWVWHNLGLKIATRPVCEEHIAPFEFLADAYFERFQVGAYEAARGIGKTKLVSILHLLSGHYLPDFDTAHVGAVLRQAQLCFGYVRGYFKDPTFENALSKDPVMQEVSWKNGAKLVILPGTVSGTSGPHPNRAVADEFDLMPWEVYQQFIGMPMAHGDHPAQSIYTSAMVTSFGPMARLLEESAKREISIYRSCIFDSMQPCDGRNGRPECVDLKNVRRGVKLNPPACPLWNECHGRATLATGHVKLTDVLNKFNQSDNDTWLVQYRCQRGGRKGLVFEDFDPNPAPLGASNVSPDVQYNPELPIVWMCDEGWNPDPMVVLAANQLPNGDLHVFEELYVTQTQHEKMVEYVHGFEIEPVTERKLEIWPWHVIDWDPTTGPRETGEVHHYKKPSAVYCGVSDKFMQAAFTKLNLVVRVPTKTGVLDGDKEVRKMVKDAQGHRGLVFHPRCKNSIADFSHYHRQQLKSGEYTDKPAANTARSNPDDGCEAVRRFASFRLEGLVTRIEPAFKN